MTVLLARGITSVPEAEIEEHELRLDLGRPIYVCNPISDQMHHASTLLGGSSFARFCQQEFGEFPRPAWAVGSYSSGPPAGATLKILVDKTSPMSGRLRV